MQVFYGFRYLVGAAVIALVVADRAALAQQALPQQGAAPQATDAQQSQLRWTPHRVAQAAPAGPVDNQQAQQTQQAQPSNPAEAAVMKPTPKNAAQAALPQAAVTLPDGVPPVTGPTVPGYDARNPTNNTRVTLGERFTQALNLPTQPLNRRTATPTANVAPLQPQPTDYAPLRGAIDSSISNWTSGKGNGGAFQAPREPADQDSILGINVMRTPQGNYGRPVLAPEGQRSPATAMNRRPQPFVGGGEAPRFDPQAVRAARLREERLAMNVDGIPSVMSRDPQAAALDSAAVPNPMPAPGSMGPSTTIESLPGEGLPFGMGDMPPGAYDGQMQPDDGQMMMTADQGMWSGQYPSQVHVESFYDDPYACEDGEECGCLPMWDHHDGRICAWLRRFGRPYYGWRWYRDFTASAGVTSFTNPTDLGLHGNYGTNEYLNWAMPFWNAFGIGWQAGVRGVQTNFSQTDVTLENSTLTKSARDQVFVTTGFFTRAFEGRGLQGGAVYDYLSDAWFDEVDVAQIRTELSYVWGYHEIGYWGAHNILDQISIFTPRRQKQAVAGSIDFYSAFYRLHFGDANEWRVWGGATSDSDGIIGSSIRAPMTKSFAMEGAFTYLIPGESQTVDLDGQGTLTTFSPAAWNVSVNLVYYPACRSRRSLASPYRPLFDVADNGSLIRSIAPYVP